MPAPTRAWRTRSASAARISHEWIVDLEAWRRQHGLESGEVDASTPVVQQLQSNVGATVMGRNMFGGGPGPWRKDPPGTAGGATTDGIESALEQAKQAAVRQRRRHPGDVMVLPQGRGKSQVVVERDPLPNSEAADAVRAAWRKRLGTL